MSNDNLSKMQIILFNFKIELTEHQRAPQPRGTNFLTLHCRRGARRSAVLDDDGPRSYPAEGRAAHNSRGASAKRGADAAATAADRADGFRAGSSRARATGTGTRATGTGTRAGAPATGTQAQALAQAGTAPETQAAFGESPHDAQTRTQARATAETSRGQARSPDARFGAKSDSTAHGFVGATGTIRSARPTWTTWTTVAGRAAARRCRASE